MGISERTQFNRSSSDHDGGMLTIRFADHLLEIPKNASSLYCILPRYTTSTFSCVRNFLLEQRAWLLQKAQRDRGHYDRKIHRFRPSTHSTQTQDKAQQAGRYSSKSKRNWKGSQYFEMEWLFFHASESCLERQN